MKWAALDRLVLVGWLALSTRELPIKLNRLHLTLITAPLLPRVRSSLLHVFDLLSLLATPIRTDWAERPLLVCQNGFGINVPVKLSAVKSTREKLPNTWEAFWPIIVRVIQQVPSLTLLTKAKVGSPNK